MQNYRCFDCEHYIGDLKCIAFPERIPTEILIAENEHTKPLKDQFGEFVYKPKTKKGKL